MAEALSVFKSANIPTPEALISTLDTIHSEYSTLGAVILKFAKGHWTFGTDDEEIEPGSRWAVNPFSFIHGAVAFGGDGTPVASELLGEKMAPMTEPKPELGPAPEHATAGWQTQLGFTVKCMSGDDEGMEARFTTNSKGGVRAVTEFISTVIQHMKKDPSNPVPVVVLKTSSYQHKNPTYGRIYVPVFEVVDWIGGKAEEAVVEEVAVETPVEERRRRRSRA